MNNISELPFLDPIIDLIQYFITHGGLYAPMLLLILEEGGLPLPVPGDIAIAFTGYKVSVGAISYIGACVLLLISILVGASILYFISSYFGLRFIHKYGNFLNINDKKLETLTNKFKKYGFLVIIIGRQIPGFKIPITIFAGVSKIPYITFILSIIASVIGWIPLYLGIGLKLGARTATLIRGHHAYFLVTLIPFVIFAGFLVLVYIKRNKNKVSTDNDKI